MGCNREDPLPDCFWKLPKLLLAFFWQTLDYLVCKLGGNKADPCQQKLLLNRSWSDFFFPARCVTNCLEKVAFVGLQTGENKRVIASVSAQKLCPWFLSSPNLSPRPPFLHLLIWISDFNRRPACRPRGALRAFSYRAIANAPPNLLMPVSLRNS